MNFQDFYPTSVNPIHPVNDWCKVRKLIRDARRGFAIPAFIVDGENLITGTHRCAANDIMIRLYEHRDMSPKPCLIDSVQFADMDLDDETRERAIEAMENDDYSALDGMFDHP
jgi:hypothetical protein